MKRSAFAVLAVVFLLASAAQAVPPAYYGPMGNPEEPALRPYKWLWHGIKVLVYHPVARFNQGNSVYPGVGSLMVWQGAREGVVGLAESGVRGSLYAIPPEPDAFKDTGSVNAALMSDPLVSTVVDLPTLPVKALAGSPAKLQEEMDTVEQKAREIRRERREARKKRLNIKDLPVPQRPVPEREYINANLPNHELPVSYQAIHVPTETRIPKK